MLENVTEGFKVRVASPDDGLSKFESGYIGLLPSALELVLRMAVGRRAAPRKI